VLDHRRETAMTLQGIRQVMIEMRIAEQGAQIT